jgi:hypothetical protein
MAIRRTTVTVTGAAGGAGAATANAISTHVVNGLVLAVYVEYTDSPPVTTDVTIVEANNSPAMPILTLTDNATPGWYQPMADAEDISGAAIGNLVQQIAINDYIKATIAQANDGDGCVVTVVWMEA